MNTETSAHTHSFDEDGQCRTCGAMLGIDEPSEMLHEPTPGWVYDPVAGWVHPETSAHRHRFDEDGFCRTCGVSMEIEPLNDLLEWEQAEQHADRLAAEQQVADARRELLQDLLRAWRVIDMQREVIEELKARLTKYGVAA
jgi:hypothetical protein